MFVSKNLNPTIVPDPKLLPDARSLVNFSTVGHFWLAIATGGNVLHADIFGGESPERKLIN